MSTQKKYKSYPKKSESQRSKLALFGALVIMVVVLIIGITSYFYGRNEGQRAASPIPTIDVSQYQGQRVLGAQTKSWHGQIAAVGNSKISMIAQARDSNNELKNIQIEAIIKPSTQIQKWDLTGSNSVQNPGSNKTDISAADLQLGHEIIVRSNEDINENNEISATSIQVIITPTTK